jgi:hypothetical protein
MKIIIVLLLLAAVWGPLGQAADALSGSTAVLTEITGDPVTRDELDRVWRR